MNLVPSLTRYCVQSRLSLRDPPTYDALSYCWGSLELSQTSTVKRAGIKVIHIFKEAPRPLWARYHSLVDAIYVNQLRAVERGSQLAVVESLSKEENCQ